MGDSEGKIEYTPAELAEIDKVLGVLPLDELPRGKAVAAAQEPPERETPAGEVDEFVDLGEEEPVAARSEEPEELVDVTDLIQEVPEEGAPARGARADDLDILSAEGGLAEVPEIDTGEPAVVPEEHLESVEELPSLEELPSFEEEKPAARPARATKKEPETLSTLDELEALTADEVPGETPGEEGLSEEPSMDVSMDRGAAADVPDLSDMSLDSKADIPEASVEEIPEIDLDTIPDAGSTAAATEPAGFDAGGIDDIQLDDLSMAPSGELEEVTDLDRPARERRRDTVVEDLDTGPVIKGIDEIEEVAETVEMPEVEEEPAPPKKPSRPGKPAAAAAEGETELSDRDLRKLKTAVSLYHPNLRKAITEAIVDEMLPPKEQRQLVDMIITSKPEDNVQRFLEKKLGRTIDTSQRVEIPGRKVLTSRVEYTREGMERQKQLLKFSKVFGVAALVTCVITVLLFQFVYKPAMAKKRIREGVALIRKPGVPPYQRSQDFQEAERLFRIVDEDYAKDYIPGYNAYARAYFDVKEYEYSYQKLKTAYEIKPGAVETLNNLGYFYARIPEDYYQARYASLVPPDKKEPTRDSRLDIAIRFYNHALTREPSNITALYGIGNTYMYQGRYFEARQYFENILKHDRDSVVGHSGLLNLFIERDSFQEVATLHSRIKDRDILEDLEPALLAKLAWYYLSKKRTDAVNIRVDYGAQAGRFRDLADNPYPVVRSVLGTLADRHPEYPPLYVHKALLSRDTGNLKMMREYLELAVEKEPSYFGAHHLMGEYHLLVKEPVDAYREFKAALKAYQSPPDFTTSDFYKETESVARTYGLMGNVFYYYFDKVRSRFRHSDELEEVVVDSELEKKANDGIAQQYYEKAVAMGDKSSEVFYNLGRLYYVRGLHNKALEMWLNLYDDFIARPELMIALGNAFFRMNNLESSKGEYLRLISVLERETEEIQAPNPRKTEHLKLYHTLSSAYNNLGAIYQLQGNEVKSNLCYWRSIEYSKQLEKENEYARVNMARSFRERREAVMPLLDDEIPFSMDVYRADMR